MLIKIDPVDTDNFKEAKKKQVLREYQTSVLHVAITPQQNFHKKCHTEGSIKKDF